MRITLVICNRQSGGAQRMMCLLANYWVANGWQVTFLTTHQQGRDPFFQLDPKIDYRDLDLPGESDRALPMPRWLTWLKTIRRGVLRSKPEVVLSFIDKQNTMVLMSMLGRDIPIVVSERNNPAMTSMGKRWILFRNILYPRAARIVVQTDAAAAYFGPAIRKKISVIPNPVVLPPPANEAVPVRSFPEGRNNVIGMGRLKRQKGFDMLLEAFARLAPKFPTWDLTIFGDGEERENLGAMVEALNLKDRAFLPGSTSAAAVTMRSADMLVLSSRFEGIPNVLCEAMACGTPVISFDCPTGPSEIIRDGVDGLLVPPEDVDALTDAMERAMSDPALRDRLAAAAPDIMSRFDIDTVMGMWEQVFRGAVNR